MSIEQKDLDMEIDCYYLNVMQDYLEKEGKLSNPTQGQLDRKAGKKLEFKTHIKYVIHAQLTNQEKWSNIENNIEKIDEAFFHYDIKKIKKQSGDYFYNKIEKYIVRGLRLKDQMKYLHDNIGILESINNKDGGLDSYVFSMSPKEIIINFVTEHKLNCMGISLICEYLKNVGVECAKPDTHIMRFLSKTRRGLLKKDEAHIPKKGKNKGKILDTTWTDNDKIKALEIIENIGKVSGKTASDIDRIIWSYCADNHGEICTKTPKCNNCIVREGCNHNKKLGVQF